MSSHDEFDFESIPGLPGELPPGEHVIWRGSPDARALALHVFHVRKMALYFAILIGAHWAHSLAGGQSVLQALANSRGPALFAGIALGILLILARFSARATIYTLTNRRIVIRHGIALPMSLNLPFAVIDAAAVKTYAAAGGEIAVKLSPGQRIGYLLNWPHVRRWHLLQPQPSLRAIADVSQVAELLGNALAATSPHKTMPEPQLETGAPETLRPTQPAAA